MSRTIFLQKNDVFRFLTSFYRFQACLNLNFYWFCQNWSYSVNQSSKTGFFKNFIEFRHFFLFLEVYQYMHQNFYFEFVQSHSDILESLIIFLLISYKDLKIFRREFLKCNKKWMNFKLYNIKKVLVFKSDIFI